MVTRGTCDITICAQPNTVASGCVPQSHNTVTGCLQRNPFGSFETKLRSCQVLIVKHNTQGSITGALVLLKGGKFLQCHLQVMHNKNEGAAIRTIHAFFVWTQSTTPLAGARMAATAAFKPQPMVPKHSEYRVRVPAFKVKHYDAHRVISPTSTQPDCRASKDAVGGSSDPTRRT